MKTINPKELPVPPSYSHAAELSLGAARIVLTAGQIGMDAEGNVPSTVELQTRLVFRNLGLVLAAAGMELADVAKTTIYLTDPADFPAFSKVRGEILGPLKPASTLVYVSQLIRSDLRVEVEAMAVKTA